MLLIPTIEAIVGGPVSAWPRVVLHFLFSVPPDASSVATKAVAAFLYGNGVRCTLAINFVKAGVDDDDCLLMQIFDFHYEWAESTAYIWRCFVTCVGLGLCGLMARMAHTRTSLVLTRDLNWCAGLGLYLEPYACT